MNPRQTSYVAPPAAVARPPTPGQRFEQTTTSQTRHPQVAGGLASIRVEADFGGGQSDWSAADEAPRDAVIKATPPWLVSLLLHMTFLIAMGLWLLPSVVPNVLQLDATFAEELGEQLDEEVMRFAMDDDAALEQVITPDDLPEVEDPFVAPSEIVLDPLGLNATSELVAPNIGMALSGREPGMKQALLAAYGGNRTTESAVAEGLEWLKRNQLRDGTWSLSGPYSDGAPNANPTSATAMALLAFQGAGHTHQSGKHKDVVARGIDALLKMQQADGDFFVGNVPQHRMYSQAQAMIAVCELYGMTKDSRLRQAARNSVAYAVKTQDSLGGWRYRPGFDSDTSVTGWFVMGLKSAMMAGLEVPAPTLENVRSYLDRVAASDGARYGYQPGNEATYPMTAEALLCRQYLGWSHEDPRLQNGVRLISLERMRMEEQNVYYWYYAAQVLHHYGGDEWDNWNRVMRQLVPENQTRKGPERGSWSPVNDRWGPFAGRLYTTCLSIYMLEVYYRHLPIYQSMEN